MALTNSWIDSLREQTDIVKIVGEYVSLRPKGHRHWACCPFHGEKTPSFEVDSTTQMFYCFGCHKGGNVFNFVMEMEHMEFMDAAKLLAEKVGFAIPESVGREPRDPNATSERRNRVYECNRTAALFFHKLLYAEEGANGLAYLHKRGLDDVTIRRFGLGASPVHGGGALIGHLKEQGFTEEELKLSGLVRESEKDGSLYDNFRNRVMFPIINPQGRVLGFGGRVLDGSQPKYLNTSDTIVFNKRKELYGLNMVKKQGKQERLLLVEGYMDVVSLVQKGVTGVVATLGTALTPEQVALICRYAPKAYVAYDGDDAGQNAIARAIGMFRERGSDDELRILRFPDNRDPDEYIREFGKDAFDALPTLAPVRWELERLENSLDLSDKEARGTYAIEGTKLIARLPNPVERDSYIEEMVIKTGFAKEVLLSQLGSVAPVAAPATSAANPAQRRAAKPFFSPRKEDEHLKPEKLLLSLYAHGHCPEELLREEDFEDELHKKLAHMLVTEKMQPAAAIESFEDAQEREKIIAILEQDIPGCEENGEQMAADCADKMRFARLTHAINELTEACKTAQDTAQKREILMQITKLNKEKSKLKSRDLTERSGQIV